MGHGVGMSLFRKQSILLRRTILSSPKLRVLLGNGAVLVLFGFAALSSPIAYAAESNSSLSQATIVTSSDGTKLRVRIDTPSSAIARGVTIVLVAGTGAFDEDVDFGNSGTSRDYVFKELANRFSSQGYHVVRYAKRGVPCIEEASKAHVSSSASEPDQKQENCLSEKQLATVTTGSQVDDLVAVVGQATKIRGKLIVIGHSEGFVVLARAMEAGKVKPDGIVGIGALLESPESVLRWQISDRIADSLIKMDANKDGVTTNEEVDAGYQGSWASVYGNIHALKSPSGAWSAAQIGDVRAAWSQMYSASKGDAASKLPNELFKMGAIPVASYQWWQSWFSDTRPVIERVQTYSGKVSLLYGANDPQTPPERQLKALKSSSALIANWHSRVFPNLGHTLGPDVLMGPMDLDAQNFLLQEVERVSLSN